MRRRPVPELTLYAAAGAAIWIGEFHRKDIIHLAFGSPLLLIVFFYILAELPGRFVRIATRTLAFSAVSLALFDLVLVTVAPRPLQTRVGTLKTLSPTGTVRFLMTHVAAGEEIFVYPYRPSYYFITGTTNPTPYSFLIYGYNTKAQFQEVISTLETRKIKYVSWDTTYNAKVAPHESLPKDPREFIFERYLQCRYKVIQDDHGERVMQRRDETEISENQCGGDPM